MDFFRAGQATGSRSWTVTEGAVTNYGDVGRVHGGRRRRQSGEEHGGRRRERRPTSTWWPSEHVTCVYTNTYVPPPGGLVIQKVTRGGVGTFDYTVNPRPGGEAHDVSATTTDPGVPATAEPSLDSLAPGTYKISEKAPDSEAGHWRAVSVNCNGEREQRPWRRSRSRSRSGQASTARSSTGSSRPARSRSRRSARAPPVRSRSSSGCATPTSAMQYTQRATTKAEGQARRRGARHADSTRPII